MFEIFGIPSQVLFGQLLLGLINGSFYALLSLGLAVIFGMLNIINFAHGAQYMMGAFMAFFLLQYVGLNYWAALVVAPVVVGASGIVIERLFLQWLYQLDHLYGLLLTFGLALIIEGVFRNYFGSSGLPYRVPDLLQGGQNLGFMFLPNYRAWVVVFSLGVCLTTWFVIERTKLGSYLRAATENPTLVRAFGINVPRMITLTYGFGVALAALSGVMAAPIYNVSPQMGANLIIVVFAVVVIGGMGSIMGAIITGFRLGIFEGLTKGFFPEASNTVIFIIMAIVLLIRPAGLFGRGDGRGAGLDRRRPRHPPAGHLFRHDHFGAGADDVLLRSPGAFYRRRGRHPGSAAPPPVRPHQPGRADAHVWHGSRHLSRWLPADLSHHPLAVRRSAEGDPRERGARHLARLQDRALQARGVRVVGHLCGSRGRDQGDRVPARLVDGRRLADVRRVGADDARRRARDRIRAGDGGIFHGDAGDLPDAGWPMGGRGAGHDFRHVRAAVLPRHHRRACTHPPPPPMTA